MKSSFAVYLMICAVSLGVAVLFALPPKKSAFKNATPAEIRAVLPTELLEETPVDPAAVDRYKQIARLIDGFDEKPFAKLQDYSGTPTTLEIARDFEAKTAALRSGVDAVLAKGPIQGLKGGYISKNRHFAACIAKCALVLARNGDIARGSQMLATGCRLVHAIRESKVAGILNDADFMEIPILRSVRAMATQTSLPASDCSLLLDAIGTGREGFKVGIRGDFQYLLKGLGDGKEMAASARQMLDRTPDSGQIAGSYDAIATARSLGELYAETMANADKPYCEMTFHAYEAAAKAAIGLPKIEIDSYPGPSDYGEAMSHGENTIGRALVGQLLLGHNPDSLALECRHRAQRDCTRILLASAIYRSSHNGSLPASNDELVPLLGAWPDDPFNGKPMRYDSRKQVAYSVGQNLKDDGADPKLDVVVSLKRD